MADEAALWGDPAILCTLEELHAARAALQTYDDVLRTPLLPSWPNPSPSPSPSPNPSSSLNPSPTPSPNQVRATLQRVASGPDTDRGARHHGSARCFARLRGGTAHCAYVNFGGYIEQRQCP